MRFVSDASAHARIDDILTQMRAAPRVTPLRQIISATSSTSLVDDVVDSSDIDEIVLSMQRSARKRTAADEMAEIWSRDERLHRERQRSLELFDAGTAFKRVRTASTQCTNCGECDQSKFSLTSDKSEVSCSSCGACFKKAAPKSHNFEKTQRADVHQPADGTNSRADGIDDASKRLAERVNELESTRVGGALRSAQSSIQRRAVRDFIENEQKLTKTQSTKRDKIIIGIHAIFRSSGLNPDSCVLCSDATTLANSLFMRCALHIAACGAQKACRCGAIDASPRTLAMECTRKAIDRALSDPDSDTCALVGGRAGVQKIASELSPAMQAYVEQSNVSNVVGRRVSSILAATHAELVVPCVVAGDDAGDAAPPPPSADGDDDDDVALSPNNDIDMQRLQLSIQSIGSIGWAEHGVIEKAFDFAVTPTCHTWMTDKFKTWPVDLLAMLIVLAHGENTANDQLHLRQLCNQHSILLTSATEQLATLQLLTRPAPAPHQRTPDAAAAAAAAAAATEFGAAWG